MFTGAGRQSAPREPLDSEERGHPIGFALWGSSKALLPSSVAFLPRTSAFATNVEDRSEPDVGSRNWLWDPEISALTPVTDLARHFSQGASFRSLSLRRKKKKRSRAAGAWMGRDDRNTTRVEDGLHRLRRRPAQRRLLGRLLGWEMSAEEDEHARVDRRGDQPRASAPCRTTSRRRGPTSAAASSSTSTSPARTSRPPRSAALELGATVRDVAAERDLAGADRPRRPPVLPHQRSELGF